MNKQEFESRTLVEVSESEYEAIETVYMNSDLNNECKSRKGGYKPVEMQSTEN